MSEEECKCAEGAPAWMATFSDLCTLLLTFFVLLLSFADMNVREFKAMLGSVRDAFGVQFETQGSYEALSSSPVSLDGRQPQQNESEAEDEMQARIEALGLEDEIEVEADEGGLTVRIRERVLFGSGSADLSVEEAGPILRTVVELGMSMSTELAVHGHTDDRPIQNVRYPSNWELSAARASSVVRYLVGERLIPEAMKVSIAGYADTRPVVPNDSDEHRARNRRVEFRFVGALRDPDAEADESADEPGAEQAGRLGQIEAAVAEAETQAADEEDEDAPEDAPSTDEGAR